MKRIALSSGYFWAILSLLCVALLIENNATATRTGEDYGAMGAMFLCMMIIATNGMIVLSTVGLRPARESPQRSSFFSGLLILLSSAAVAGAFYQMFVRN